MKIPERDALLVRISRFGGHMRFFGLALVALFLGGVESIVAQPQSTNAKPDNWGAMFKSQVERCWKKPKRVGLEGSEVSFTVKLTRDGTLAESPVPGSRVISEYAKAYQLSALEALIRCQPYKLPLEYYAEWKHFSPVFTEPTSPPPKSVSLPPVIRAATNEEMKDCGAKEIPEAAVTILDLNGDGINDYIVNFARIFENVSGCSCGNAGCPHDFWVSEKSSFVRSFSQKIQGIERIENGPQGRTVILGTHGSACNQVGSKACYFKLTWSGPKAKIEPLTSTAQSQSSATNGSHIGKWYTNDPAACAGDLPEGGGLVEYTAREVLDYETGCRITNLVSRGSKTDLTMRCSTEGTTSAALDHETVEVVGDKLKRTFRDGRKQRTMTYNRCPSETIHAGGKLFYGSRAGMTVTVLSLSGINSDRAAIKTNHTKEDAIGFCREYVGKVTAKCVQDEMAIKIRDQITGNCVTGRFTNFSGEDHQYLGAVKSKNDDTIAKYVIKNLATGQIADGSMGSGYPTNMGIFRALCPLKAPTVTDE